MQWLSGAGMQPFKIVLFAKTVLTNHVWNAKLSRMLKHRIAQFHGDHATMLIILTVLTNGLGKTKQNVLYARTNGSQLRQPKNEFMIKTSLLYLQTNINFQ